MESITHRFLALYNELLKRNYFKTPAEYARQTGLKPSAVNEILKGRSNAGLKIIHSTVSTYRDINLHWLIIGEGEMFRNREPDLTIAAEPVPSYTIPNPTTDQPETLEALRDTIRAQRETIETQKITIKTLEALMQSERNETTDAPKHPATRPV